MSFEPPKFRIVWTDDSRIARGSLAEVKPAIGSDHGAIGVVITKAREVRDDHRYAAIRRNPQDSPPFQFSAFGNVKIARVKGHACPGAIPRAGRDARRRRSGIDPQEPRRAPDFPVSIARLDHKNLTFVVEGCASREGESGGEGNDRVANWNRNVRRLDPPW